MIVLVIRRNGAARFFRASDTWPAIEQFTEFVDAAERGAVLSFEFVQMTPDEFAERQRIYNARS